MMLKISKLALQLVSNKLQNIGTGLKSIVQSEGANFTNVAFECAYHIKIVITRTINNKNCLKMFFISPVTR